MILPRIVARQGHAKVIADLRAAEGAGARSWRLVYDEFPYAGIHVLVGGQLFRVAILLEAEDWPHRPISVRATDTKFAKWLPVPDIPQQPDRENVRHVVASPSLPSWFCVIGTREFHNHYREILPWESVRHLPTNLPHQLLEACIRCLSTAPQPTPPQGLTS